METELPFATRIPGSGLVSITMSFSLLLSSLAVISPTVRPTAVISAFAASMFLSIMEGTAICLFSLPVLT